MDTIGKYQYQSLKKLSVSLTDTERELMTEYENKHGMGEPNEKLKEYVASLHAEPDDVGFEVNFPVLVPIFLSEFGVIEGKRYEDNNDNLITVLYYFCKDERFFNCDNLSKLTKPSFDKGLLIIGPYGNGKTSTMRVLKSLFNHTPLTFKSYTTNKIVSTFEGYKDVSERTAYLDRTKTKTACFADLMTEEDASNYGKFNLMKDILEERYNNQAKTYITMNYAEGVDQTVENVLSALVV